MMMHRSGIEIRQYRTRGLLRLCVGAVEGQMGQQFIQGVTLFGNAPVARFKHFQRPVEPGGRCAQQTGGHGLRVSRAGVFSGCLSKYTLMPLMMASTSLS